MKVGEVYYPTGERYFVGRYDETALDSDGMPYKLYAGVRFYKDGTVYFYDYQKNIKNNKPGLYLNKRPIYTVINNLKRINDEIDCEMCILSSCLYKEQAEEKSLWLDKYMPFIKEKNKIFVLSQNFYHI